MKRLFIVCEKGPAWDVDVRIWLTSAVSEDDAKSQVVAQNNVAVGTIEAQEVTQEELDKGPILV